MNPCDLRPHVDLAEGYTELRVQENRESWLVMVNGDLVRNSRCVEGGVSARVAETGSWGFCSSPRTDATTRQSVVAHAATNAQLLASSKPPTQQQLPCTQAKGQRGPLCQGSCLQNLLKQVPMLPAFIEEFTVMR
jgi:predicted Zn-dependent protease